MPCGTERSDPVQMLKITPVFPGAITVNELIRLARTITATRAVKILLAILAISSGESRMVLMGVLLGQRVRGEGRRIDDRRAPGSAPVRDRSQQPALDPL